MSDKTDWAELSLLCRLAMQAAAEKPGRYGGRYVARRFNKRRQETEFLLLDNDDPDLYRADEELDILAQATPTKVIPFGRARVYLQEDGTLVPGHFD